MGAMSPWHWAIVLLVVVILFGSKKLPDAARGLGRSMRIFKSEVSEMRNDKKPASGQSTTVVNGEVVKDGSASSGEGSTAADQSRAEQTRAEQTRAEQTSTGSDSTRS